MKVSDLISQLQLFPQDMDVVVNDGSGFARNIMSLERAEMDPNDNELVEYQTHMDNSVDVLAIITF